MSAATEPVRVLPHRALTLTIGEGAGAYTVLHVAGAELELDPADASTLAEQGFVEAAGPPTKTPTEARERRTAEHEEDLH